MDIINKYLRDIFIYGVLTSILLFIYLSLIQLVFDSILDWDQDNTSILGLITGMTLSIMSIWFYKKINNKVVINFLDCFILSAVHSISIMIWTFLLDVGLDGLLETQLDEFAMMYILFIVISLIPACIGYFVFKVKSGDKRSSLGYSKYLYLVYILLPILLSSTIGGPSSSNNSSSNVSLSKIESSLTNYIENNSLLHGEMGRSYLDSFSNPENGIYFFSTGVCYGSNEDDCEYENVTISTKNN